MTTWTDEKMEFLKLNYLKMPSREIAETVGTTRAAIMGKARKMGLSISTKTLPRGTKNATPRKSTEVTERGNKFYMEELEAGMCRYPYGDGTPYLFCGEPCKGAYCPRHHKLCYAEKVKKDKG